ncbi:hypothetical protein DPMN_091624 [Dreissena polymorpha]|uniref:Uncharacterized protein n=1 Tax=Dreissena polymorpha TaxID=45954 RepID=A0A9D4L0R2_DREPO|nr:hypothetical protein DPMN_091624 [Dreissena polymorpha]
MATFENINTQIQDNITDLRLRSIRGNLVFAGVPESIGNTELHDSCETTLQRFLTEKLENDKSMNKNDDIHINNITFARVHRITGGSNSKLYLVR